MCFQGSFLEKGVLTGKCGRRRGIQTLNYTNMHFSTCGTFQYEVQGAVEGEFDLVSKLGKAIVCGKEKIF